MVRIGGQLQIRALLCLFPEMGPPVLASQPAAALLKSGSLQHFPLWSQTQPGLLVLFSVRRCSKNGRGKGHWCHVWIHVEALCISKHTETWLVGFC